MLLKSAHTCEVSGDLAAHSFSIAANPKMFKILSDGLYSDKALAVTRELLSNAYDAHIAAGTLATPIHIHVPNDFEPWLQVTDFGTGLSHDDVIHLYTTYGASTKSESNDQIGGFGLGSKSPLAYTDQFTVESRFDGVHSTYQVFIAESGIPHVTMLEAVSTDQPNGMSVKVPIAGVTDADYRQFIRALNKLVPHMATAPIISGATDDHVESINKMHVEPTFVLPMPDSTRINSIKLYEPIGYAQRQSALVQGITPYHMDNYRWQGFAGIDILDDVSVWGAYYVVIDAKIGQFELTASREDISWTDETKQSIANIFTEADGVMYEFFTERMQNITNWIDGWHVGKALGWVNHSFYRGGRTAPIKPEDTPFKQWMLPDAGWSDLHSCSRSFMPGVAPRGMLYNPRAKMQDSRVLTTMRHDTLAHIPIISLINLLEYHNKPERAILVSPVLNRPYKKHCQLLSDTKNIHRFELWHGDIDVVRQFMDDFGFNINVIELQSIKSDGGARTSGKVESLADSSKEFDHYVATHEPNPVHCHRGAKETLQTLLDRYDNRTDVSVTWVLCESDAQADELYRLYSQGVVKVNNPDMDLLLTIYVDPRFTNVRQMFKEECTEYVYDYDEIQREWEYDYNVVISAMCAVRHYRFRDYNMLWDDSHYEKYAGGTYTKNLVRTYFEAISVLQPTGPAKNVMIKMYRAARDMGALNTEMYEVRSVAEDLPIDELDLEGLTYLTDKREGRQLIAFDQVRDLTNSMIESANRLQTERLPELWRKLDNVSPRYAAQLRAFIYTAESSNVDQAIKIFTATLRSAA